REALLLRGREPEGAQRRAPPHLLARDGHGSFLAYDGRGRNANLVQRGVASARRGRRTWMLGRAVLVALLLAVELPSSAASDGEATRVVPAPELPCDEENRVAIDDPDAGRYTTCLGTLTRREQVLSIIDEYVREPRRREPPSLSETAIGRCRYAITLPAGERV